MRKTTTPFLLGAIALTLGLAGCASTPPSTSFSGMKPGTCFNAAGGDANSIDFHTSTTKVACNDPHDFEYYAVKDIAQDGNADFARLSNTFCTSEYAKYEGSPLAADSKYSANYIFPTKKDWSSGIREIVCFISAPQAKPDTKLTGSAKNAS